MEVKVKLGIVAYKGTKYKKDEVIRGVDKQTANYLLSMNVVDKIEASTDIIENVTKNYSEEMSNKKSKNTNLPKKSE